MFVCFSAIGFRVSISHESVSLCFQFKEKHQWLKHGIYALLSFGKMRNGLNGMVQEQALTLPMGYIHLISHWVMT
jgi:hypothetical protein